ncbi:hypothetical protein [Bacteroides sp. 51]|uniref:hypothetical protein n=1 Tax=Bacteroides sp. 51 TaxID=2302938 RepID=UPI0013D1C015|nr:hypothetical protein [Bacteroides sp. 51]NDV83588.1 hypothetical protein [Bacteroides sp. 51]
MKSNESKDKKKATSPDIRNAVQQIRPNNNQDTIMKPATKKEVKEAVREINPDEGTLDRG